MIGTGLQTVEMVLHTAAVVDHSNLVAGNATPVLTTHLAAAVVLYPIFAATFVGLIIVAGARRCVGLTLDLVDRDCRARRPWGRSGPGGIWDRRRERPVPTAGAIRCVASSCWILGVSTRVSISVGRAETGA